jgi:methyl-accepting chemotaxis protein
VLWASGLSVIALGGVTDEIWIGAWKSRQIIPLLALAVAFAGFVGTAFFAFIVSPTIGNLLKKLADVAEAVAAGDLTKHPEEVNDGGEIGRLARAMAAMTAELSRLAAVIRSSTSETNTFAVEITGGTEHLAQAASGIALTASTLSSQAVQMADTINALTDETSKLGDVARTLAAGARDGLERNRHLKSLASDNHVRLEESFNRLGALSQDVQASADAVDALGAASDEIRAFVTLVQKIARQSKLLALNAAMEAARAGEQGEGFAVVATEVRRLAANTAGAAEQTETLIQGILGRLDEAREASARALDRVQAVKEATEHGRRSFTQVEEAVREADQWTEAMAASAAAGDVLVSELQQRLSMLNSGTQSFANAMHDVAAASEEQSASTEEIAAAAGQLSQTAERLDQATSVFKVQ